MFSVAILTVSDRCSRGQTEDTSGPALAEIVRQELHGDVVTSGCVPDEAEVIRQQLETWCSATPVIDLVLTTGGTGLGPRDVTPEATLAVLERRHAGLMELMRLRCFPEQPRAFLSRGEAGTRGSTLIINLPGSPRGSTECLRALLDVLPHALEILRGEGRHIDERETHGHDPAE
ncbi:MAG TPA: MogA/MoaB family molybdenum cofactor biosynthesis protein [Phycisphaerae bacterium]|nr:MogA/MoaB family molybdenum cofactor biosynthesis protein [Phycisphaerae bacterium]